MFNKKDILPLILAFASTILIVGMGFSWLTQSSITVFGKESKKRRPKIDTDSSSVAKTESSSDFAVPVLVPQGTSVSINGSAKLKKINQALRRSFHKKYPGTMIVTNADGIDAALKLLYSGEVDLVALDRPLNTAEKAAGLRAIPINNLNKQSQNKATDMFYVYQNPPDLDTEAFLGYALSTKLPQATTEFQLRQLK